MYELKTKPSHTNPLDVIAQIPNPQKQADALALLEIFAKATEDPAVVWGEKQIGFGSYHYRYASGHQGKLYAVGFAVTKTKITLYLYLPPAALQAYLTKLGKAAAGKSCLYINKLADVSIPVLEEMIRQAYQEIHALYP